MNPISQMKQRKTSQETAQNGANNAMNTKTQPTTAPKAKPAQNRKLAVNHYPQVRYIFQQAKWSAANCKVNYPHCFHFKQNQRKQIAEICQIFAQSDRLFDELRDTLTAEQRQILTQHSRALRFLRGQLQSVADYIDQVEQAEGEALNALCYRKE